MTANMHHLSISRRDFLKLAGSGLLGALLPPGFHNVWANAQEWPTLPADRVPAQINDILSGMPALTVDQSGRMLLGGPDGQPVGVVPLAPTDWNTTHSRAHHRLTPHQRWGIVIHWYGDRENYDHTLRGYLRGFNSLREIEGLTFQTSAHFLVTPQAASVEYTLQGETPGIVQMQSADPADGTPYVASHVMGLDYDHYKAGKHYFMRALYQLHNQYPALYSLLQDLYERPQIEPNQRTIAIEMSGYNFEHPLYSPTAQQMANTLAVIWAVMRRYGIRAIDILGHQEISLGKPDPGKKTLALIRYLVGVKALVEPDPVMKELVFGPFMNTDQDRTAAVLSYFTFVRSYLCLVAPHTSIYEWEAASQFWQLHDLLVSKSERLPGMRSMVYPTTAIAASGNGFLHPGTHSGVDLYMGKLTRQALQSQDMVQLVGTGRCIYVGEIKDPCGKKTAAFRHRQPDGAEVVSIYTHLDTLNDIQKGDLYPVGYPIGHTLSSYAFANPYLHLSFAYASAWEVDLQRHITPPVNAGPTWVQQRFLPPLPYLDGLAKRLETGTPASDGVTPGVKGYR